MTNYELVALVAMHRGRFGEVPDYITMSAKVFNEWFHSCDVHGSEANAAVEFGEDRIPVVSSLIVQGGDAFSVSNSDFDMSTPWRVVQCRWICYNFYSCEYGFSDDAGRAFKRPEKPKPPQCTMLVKGKRIPINEYEIIKKHGFLDPWWKRLFR